MKNFIKSFKITPWVVWVGFLGIFLAAGVAAGLLVFWKGLSVTNLSDLVPWGLWITIDTGLRSLGAFSFSLSEELGLSTQAPTTP